MPGACCTRGLVCKVAHKEAHTSIQVQSEHSGIPCAMVLRLMPCSPRRRIRLVTVVCGLRFVQARLGRRISARRSISNGCQDHTVLPYAVRLHQKPRRVWYPSAEVLAKADSAPLVLRAVARSREAALRTHRTRDAAASTASHPASVTIAIRPS